jgi:predicted phage baseplate assembly protein
LCRLPDGPLAYKDTRPGGETPPESTLEVEVVVDGQRERWDEVDSLIHSDEGGNDFVVETDEEGRSLLRFGDGTNGRRLPEGAEVHCVYQVARGLDGNVGADSLRSFDAGAFPAVGSCWNPFDVVNGRDPEPVEEIIRRAPEAYRRRQLRAVTLKDYVDRAEEHPGVSRAAARYMWTGSWRTVRVTVDPVGTTTLAPELRAEVARYLDAVRLIGEDLEVRPPRFVPLDILVSLCVAPDYWPQDVRFVLEQEFSDGYTPDGRRAFFHPDNWTFGQGLWASQIVGWVQSVEGVDHVTGVSLKRWNEATAGTPDLIEVRPSEILQARNDPDHMEKGSIKFDLKGGRR